jgi:hypothetical protein
MLPDGSADWIWREDAVTALLAGRDEILRYLATVEPRLRATATVEIDATAPVAEVVRRLEKLS